VEPEVVELQEGFSPSVERAMPVLLSAAVDQLRAWGHDVSQADWKAICA